MSKEYVVGNEALRVIVWGPGEVGGTFLASALDRTDIEVVGVRVFNPEKHGVDVGTLVGKEPVGVVATTSRDEILALDADCVILTPAARSLWAGLDDDVIALLESGKNVISTVGYHNPARLNWTSELRPHVSRLRDACVTGGTSLFGTGVHPSFMAERLAMSLAHTITEVDHIRVVEALDFATAPEGMWDGLDNIGFGRELDDVGDDTFIAKIGDLYYADIAANIGHHLLGASPDDVRVERTLRGIAAVADIEAGGVMIRKGTAAALHLTHRGYLGDNHFFTNEECWYVGAENAFRGDCVPFANWRQGLLGYAIVVDGRPANVHAQFEFEVTEMRSPITAASVEAIMRAIGPVCEAPPGILIDDIDTHVRLDERVAPVLLST